MPEIITQKIQINGVPIEIFKELVTWSEAPWWPEKCPMKITNTTGSIDVGTGYNLIVDMPMGPKWKATNRIIDRKNLYLRRDFFEGDLEGFEEATVTPDENGYSDIVYTFAAEVKGMLGRFFWKQAGKKLHEKNIEEILRSLKKYIERKK